MKFSRLDDWLRWQESLNPAEIELGLDRVRQVHEQLCAAPLPHVITVGGTNGKGSCVAFLESILREAGYRVGCYTSPHLVRYNERIRVAGEFVSDDVLMAAFQRVEDARGEVPLTYFEFGTLAALDIFSASRLDAVILEVGLGGRLDAVNIVDSDLALITTVDLDHASWLGETRDAIGAEKAGILRKGKPAVFGAPNPPDSLVAAAEAQGTALWISGRDFRHRMTDFGWDWHGGDDVLRGLPMPVLRGQHQLQNAAASVAALGRLRDLLPVDRRALRAGLLGANLPGRFQVMPGKPRVVLDVAHNPEAARSLAANLKLLSPAKRVIGVFSALNDKDVSGIVEPLAGLIETWHLAPVGGHRALTIEGLVEFVRSADANSPMQTHETIVDAYSAAAKTAGPEDTLVAFGSFHVVGDLLGFLETQQKS